MPETTNPNYDALADYVNASEGDPNVALCWETAEALVSAFVGASEVPAQVRNLATLQAAAELWERKKSPQGLAQFATPEGVSAVRVARDPMLSAYPLLRPFVGIGIG